MSGWLIIIVTVIYLVIGVDLLMNGKNGLGLSYLAYALANVGLYIEAVK